jgi:hypothetical protein
MKFLLLGFSVVFFMSCNQYKEPVCTGEYLQSITNFEGNYYMEMMGERTELEVVSLSKGKYKLIESGEEDIVVATCKINNDYYIEISDDDNLFQLEKIDVTKKYFIMNVQEFNQEKLDSLKIPYEVIGEDEITIISVDNSNVSPEDLVSTLDIVYPMTYNRE